MMGLTLVFSFIKKYYFHCKVEKEGRRQMKISKYFYGMVYRGQNKINKIDQYYVLTQRL